MADAGVTAAAVRASIAADVQQAIAATPFDAGQLIYIDESGIDPSTGIGLARLADNGLAVTAKVAGITLHPTNTGQPILFAAGDSAFIPGATLIPGLRYVLSSNAGNFCPDADLSAGQFRTDIGVAVSPTVLYLSIIVTGIQR